MRPVRLLFAAALTAAACVSAPALASATPPVNDNYLSSLPVDQVTFTATTDTTEATTQPDLFNPNRDGPPGASDQHSPLCPPPPGPASRSAGARPSRSTARARRSARRSGTTWPHR